MATFDSLSLELIELIALQLVTLIIFEPRTEPLTGTSDLKPLIAPYARVSRKFQAGIERMLYRTYRTSSSDPGGLRLIRENPLRVAAIHELRYTIDLPDYDPELRGLARERSKEHRANLVAFQDGLVKLWGELSAWEKPASLSLDVQAWSPGDDQTAEEAEMRWLCPEHTLGIDIDAGVELPTIECVRELGVARDGRRIYPATMNAMVLSLPNLRVLDLAMRPVQFRHKNLKAEYTAALAKMLEAPTLHKLEELRLCMFEYAPGNHDFDTGLENDPSYPNGDALSHAIRKLAQRSLRGLTLSNGVPISPALFGPPDDETPFPHLEHARIDFPILTYDGRWYYTGSRETMDADELDPDEEREIARGPAIDGADSDTDSVISINMDRADFLNGNIPEHPWRTFPDPDTFDPLMRSIVSATLRMPVLRNIIVCSKVRRETLSEFQDEEERHYAIAVNFATPGSGE
ncbi:hypothetical protein BDW74DRAFT_164921 [Aspergillus multicolor]|uniref:uncharacterized protein n=1 Tax=Aspergillus multicolor TaxID=41759 RepID=UPI003CCDBB48